jgi:hypothetical protein
MSYLILVSLFSSLLLHTSFPIPLVKNQMEEVNSLANNPTQLASGEGTLWAPYLQWAIKNPSYSGNPYDLIATVSFNHEASGDQHVTQMYYDGADTWKFRFTGTRTGKWSFITASQDPDLNGMLGEVVIHPNPDPTIKGFITAYGNKFARHVGENGELEAYLFNVYQDNIGFPANFWDLVNDRSLDYIRTYPAERWAMEYLQAARAHGVNTIYIGLAHQWLRRGVVTSDGHNSTQPDPDTFDMLERVITTVHQQGGHIHIWMWGDEERKYTPIGLEGGINGVVDRRLQRYIAARLGSLPGWSMGYGFDLHEWVSTDQVKAWADYMNQHLGWPHLLSARQESSFKTPSNLSIFSYDDRPEDNFYDTAVKRLNNGSNRPILFERRFYYYRDNVWTMEKTRQALWQFTMAGGAGAWWGRHHFRGSVEAMPNPEQLQAFSRFWEGRFLLDMARANDLTDGYALQDGSGRNIVFYKENTSSIIMDLSGLQGSQPAIAVDTKKDHAEIQLGEMSPGKHTWNAPYSSDWVVAVGDFSLPVFSERVLLPTVVNNYRPDPPEESTIPETGRSERDSERSREVSTIIQNLVGVFVVLLLMAVVITVFIVVRRG